MRISDWSSDVCSSDLADEERHVTLPFLRQQIKKSRDRDNMCLADFIDPAGDWMGGFAVGLHGLEPHSERFRADKDDYSDILLQALADRRGDAFRWEGARVGKVGGSKFRTRGGPRH